MLAGDQHFDLLVVLGQRLRELDAESVPATSAEGHQQEVQRPSGHRFGLREGGNQHGCGQCFGLSRGRSVKLVERGEDRNAREQVDLRRQDGSSFFKVRMNGMCFSTPSIVPGFSITSESAT